ncbi:MAG: hypothetical protein HDS69_04540 [Bacteroidales bacterium]|nr:hypothetical protein [Bacteroidales bacterium]
MKKFYAFSLMALAAATASAVAPVATAKKSAADAVDFEKVIRTATEVSTPNRVAAKADAYDGETWKELGQGKYKASIMADYYGASDAFADVTVYEAEGKKGLYKVEGVWADMLSVPATLIIDATDPEYVIVPNQNTGVQDNVDGITYIASQSWVASDEYGFTKDLFIEYFAEINAYETDGVIYFPAESLVLQWPEAPADSKYNTDPNKWYVGDSDGCLVLPGANYVDPWSETIEATMKETFISPMFTATQAIAGTPYTVNVKVNKEEGLIKVIDPLKLAYSTFGFQGTSPDMVIEFADPANAVIGLTSTGINGGSEDGVYYYASLSSNFDDPSECPAENRITVTEEGENTTVSFPLRSMIFIASTSGSAYYTCTTAPSSITFKTPSDSNGIEGVAIDNNDAPVEYFNLQGVRVENPAAGQLLIKRQGSEVSKTVIR